MEGMDYKGHLKIPIDRMVVSPNISRDRFEGRRDAV